ncbi:DUF927 domain-containing protein [Desulfosporosinus fructosivorans]|uniref:DUF927 domain-containing protein n=1 Tax=Desulfosporosinus fructosivorans TaxID=2018669 RepID=A0A4Z0R1M5_9FIRM|nr:DUF927 domain-containing protein [Desulfosporosinus fructosivorans]TGE35897.1 DUF927 domain-containing protein [Desulfosporosinus fructosivorans]
MNQDTGSNTDTHKFLNALYGNLESGNLYLWTLPDHRTWSFPVDDLRIMINAAQAMQDERDIYFGLGGSMVDISDNKRPLANNVSFIPALWMDIDILGPAHKQTDLPDTVEEALSILPEFLQPSITIWSGNGMHMYWLLKEAWLFDTQEENLRASNLMIRLQAYIKTLASERGWKFDSTADLSRVLRVPGTLNHKLGQKQSVYITHFNETIRYDPSELEDLIPDIDFRSEITNHGSFERRSTDASSDLMIANCQFLQHCLINAQKITYGEWLSMLTNVVRGTDGIDKCHELSSPDKGRYTPKGTDFRLSEALKMNPHTCEYIRSNHSFICPSGGCGVKSPCSFSLGTVGIARAKVNMIGIPSVEKIFNDDMLTALSIVKKQDAALYARTKDKLKGIINLVDLERAIKQHTQKMTNSEVAEIPTDEVMDLPVRVQTSGLDTDSMQDKIPDNFKVTPAGINHVKWSENGPIVTRACGCPLYISARLFNTDTETESLKISYQHMDKWRDIVIPRSMAVDSRKVIGLADKGIGVSSEGAKYLAKYLDDYLYINPHIPTLKAVSRLGWRGKEFVFPGLTKEVEIDVDDMGSRHAVKGLSPVGEYSDWLNVANQVRNYSPSARFIIAAGFAAPLLKPLAQRNFIIHNHGDSTGGKSATLWTAMSIWGDPDPIIYSFNNTTTSVERRASLFCDIPFGIDEREVLSQAQKQEISPMLYMLAQGKGKGRGGKTGLQELNMWRTIVMTTGEGPLTNASSMDGLMTRAIELEGGPLAGNLEFSKYLYGFLPQCHGHAGLAFMRALMDALGTEQRKEIINYCRQAQGWLKQYYPDRLDSHLDALACVMTADYYSSIWVFGLDQAVAGAEAMAMGTEIANKLIKKSEASESERAWLEFQDWVGENSEYLKDFATKKIGTKDGTNIYIIRRVVDEFLTKYSSAQKIIKAWAEQGKIIQRVDSEGKMRFAIQKKLGGAIVRCIVFKENSEGLF